MTDSLYPVEHDLDDLAAFAEGRLDDRARARMAAHLAGCRECRDTLALLARGLDEPAAVRPAVRRWLPVAAALAIGVTAAGALILRRPAPIVTAPATPALPSAVPPSAPTPTAPLPGPTPQPGPTAPPGLTAPPAVRGGGVRRVGRKQFRLVAGEWLDESYDPADALPSVDVRSAADRTRVLAAVPDLAPFFRLGPKVTVVLQGTVYRLDLAPR
jgi:hypothetical protein